MRTPNNNPLRAVVTVIAVACLLAGVGWYWLRQRNTSTTPPASTSASVKGNLTAGSNAISATPPAPIETNPSPAAATTAKPAPGPVDTATPESRKLVEEARGLIATQKLADALDRLNSAMQGSPKLAEAYLLRGRVYQGMSKPDEALADFQRAERLSKSNPTDKAASVSLPDLWEWRGEVLLQQTNGPAAIQEFSRVIDRQAAGTSAQTDSTNIVDASTADRPFVMRGYAYLIANEPEKALPDLNYWIKRHAADPLGYFYRGQVQTALGQADAAAADFSRVIELDKTYIGAWEFRGSVYYHSRQYQQALDDFLAALKLSDRSEYAARMAGFSAFKLGRLPQTIELFTQALKLDPTNALVLENRGSAHAQMEEWPEALADYTAAANLRPSVGKLQFYRANFQLCVGNLDAAIATAETGLACDDLDPEQRQYLVILTALGKPGNEQAQLRLKSLKLPPVPTWPGPVIQLLRGDISYADALRAVDNEGERGELRTYAGWQDLIAGRTREGLDHLRWMSQEGDHRLFEYHLALVLLHQAEKTASAKK